MPAELYKDALLSVQAMRDTIVMHSRDTSSLDIHFSYYHQVRASGAERRFFELTIIGASFVCASLTWHMYHNPCPGPFCPPLQLLHLESRFFRENVNDNIVFHW